MEAISVLDNRQLYRETHSEVHRDDGRGQTPSSNKIEVLEELTHTLLKEIALLKDIQKLQTLDDQHRLSLPEEVRRFEIEIIRRTLLRTGGHQARAADLLGVNATTLNAKLKRYGIIPKLLFADETGETSFNDADRGDS